MKSGLQMHYIGHIMYSQMYNLSSFLFNALKT